MELLLILIIIVVLIAFNALYVAAEFAAVSVRRPRLAQMEQDGSLLARYVLDTVESPARLDTYVAACQIGITVSSLVLGGYGNSQLLGLAAPWVNTLDPGSQVLVNSTITIFVLLILTVIQVILGELTPKNIALQYPEQLSVLTARPMIWSVALFRPLIAIANGSAALLMRLVGLRAIAEHAHVHSPDEIRILVEESSAGGVLDREERRLLINTLELRNLTARKVMIPRNHMLAVSVETPLPEAFQLLANSNFSRIPVYTETIDSIVGVVHLKDLLDALFLQADLPTGSSPPSRDQTSNHQPNTGRATTDDSAAVDATGHSSEVETPLHLQPLARIMHGVLFVPDSVVVGDVMRLMQQEKRNMVIAVDEYGGTAGMITFEDLLEEIIGEFQDEYDAENPPLELRPNRRLRIRGDVLLEDVNEILGTAFASEEVDTMGGLVFSALGHIPVPGETVEIDGMMLRVDRLHNNAIAYVSVLLAADHAQQVTLRLQEQG